MPPAKVVPKFGLIVSQFALHKELRIYYLLTSFLPMFCIFLVVSIHIIYVYAILIVS